MAVYTNAFLLAADFSNASATIKAKANRVTRHHAMLLETRVKAHASGRPGPRVITGDYRRSWHTTTLGPGTYMVGTNKPQARRLEYGFVGPDRLGRVYNQPPFPHLAPAVALTMGPWQSDLLNITAI